MTTTRNYGNFLGSFRTNYFFASTLVILLIGRYGYGFTANEFGREVVFDFIIVGGGSAGCALARRLAEDRKFTVLLLEAGPLPDPNLSIPALSPNATFGTDVSYIKLFPTVPQRYARKVMGGIVTYPVGWTLGGGSAVNMMIFNRGSPFDYDNWARLTGDAGWSYKNLLKYFGRIEDYRGDYPSVEKGYGGPIPVTKPKYSPGRFEWLDAGKFLKYPVNRDPNRQQISFTTVEYSKKKMGRRVSSADGYLMPLLQLDAYPNLQIVVEAEVMRLHLQGRRAVGAEVKLKDKVQVVHARREIILSAGVIGSPTILLRSGIGPKEVLEESGITPVQFLPVGRNLHDHVSVTLEVVVNNSAIMDEGRDLNEKAMNLFNMAGDGPYTSFGGHAQAFLRSPKSKKLGKSQIEPESDWPNLQMIPVFGGIRNPMFTFRQDIQMAPGEGPVLIYSFLTRPKSRGNLILNASNVDGNPVLDFKYLSHPQDRDDLVWALKFALNIVENAPSFERIGARYPTNPIPGCAHLPHKTEAYLRCYIEQQAGTSAHAGGTCRMGRGPLDPKAVVDPELKVIGFENLRVVDTSIMPEVTNSNPMVGAYVIAERASDLIRSASTSQSSI